MVDPLSLLSDESLLLLIKKGDREAYAQVYARYWPILLGHCCRMLKDQEESEDVVQDTFVKFWQICPSLADDTSIGRYLYQMTRNQVLNRFAKSRVQSDYLQSLAGFMVNGYELTDHLVREKILAKIIQQEIESLPPRMREVFELKRKANLSYKEIAEVMNISELTVKTQMNKAISILRKKFGNHLTLMLPFL